MQLNFWKFCLSDKFSAIIKVGHTVHPHIFLSYKTNAFYCRLENKILSAVNGGLKKKSPIFKARVLSQSVFDPVCFDGICFANCKTNGQTFVLNCQTHFLFKINRFLFLVLNPSGLTKKFVLL